MHQKLKGGATGPYTTCSPIKATSKKLGLNNQNSIFESLKNLTHYTSEIEFIAEDKYNNLD